jgi:hypothetical protein
MKALCYQQSSKPSYTPPVRDRDRMSSVSSAELFHNVPHVNLNRFLCNEEALTYFTIALTGWYVFQHLDFTGRHAIFAHMLHHSRGQLCLYSLLAGMHIANGLDQFIGRQAFEEVAASTGLKSALDLDIAVERRKNDYARLWNSAQISVVASSPLRPGKRNSISIMSGRCWRYS